MNWKHAGILLLAIALTHCSRDSARPVRLALVPPAAMPGAGDAELEAEGLGALLLSQLRAMPGADVRIDARGCGDDGAASHALTIAREFTEQSALVTLQLHDCSDGSTRQETLVQPRAARREWSGEAAYWVAAELHVPIALPTPEGALDEVAMNQFLAAVARLNRRTRGDVAAARDALSDMVDKAPDFAHGQAQLATAELLAYEYGLQDRRLALAAAQRAIDAALRSDPDLGLAHAAQGLALMMDARYRSATPILARAAALAPGDAVIRLWLGNALLYSGRPGDAVPWLEDAIRLEPNLVAARTSRAEAACYGGDAPRCETFLTQNGGAGMDGFIRALLYAHRGQFQQADAALVAAADQVNEVWMLELRADVCAALDDARCVQRTVDVLVSEFPDEPETARLLARLRPEQPAAGNATDAGNAEPIDVWQIGLGLDALMRDAARNAPAQSRLQILLEELKAGGLRLPVLDIAGACLRSYRGDPSAAAGTRAKLLERGYRHAELWRRWQCQG
jgi:tetratricopeptide (TPR) repeat protein